MPLILTEVNTNLDSDPKIYGIEGHITVVTPDIELPIAGAKISVVKDKREFASIVSDEEGHYRIFPLELGDYQLNITADECKDKTINVTIKEALETGVI